MTAKDLAQQVEEQQAKYIVEDIERAFEEIRAECRAEFAAKQNRVSALLHRGWINAAMDLLDGAEKPETEDPQ